MKKYTLDNTEYNKTTACIIVKDHKGEMVSIPLYQKENKKEFFLMMQIFSYGDGKKPSEFHKAIKIKGSVNND